MLRWVAVNGGVNLHPPPKKTKKPFFGGGDKCQNIFVTTYPMDLKIFLGHLYYISSFEKILGVM